MLLASYCAFESNSLFADEMKCRINQLSNFVRTDVEQARRHAKQNLNEDLDTGKSMYRAAVFLAWLSLAALILGLFLLIAMLVCA